MTKLFYVFFEGDDVDGFKVMEALRKIKGYHHVQDVSRLEIGCPVCGSVDPSVHFTEPHRVTGTPRNSAPQTKP